MKYGPTMDLILSEPRKNSSRSSVAGMTTRQRHSCAKVFGGNSIRPAPRIKVGPGKELSGVAKESSTVSSGTVE